jgi:predicted permease
MTGVVEGVRVDLRRLHESWMELFFPRQRSENASVLGKWKPETTTGAAAYRVWAIVGALAVGFAYPFALFGVIARSLARGVDSTTTRLGLLGTVFLAVLVWGALTVGAYFRFTFSGFLAVLAAAVVATTCAGLGFVFSQVGGRGTTIALAYPSAMTAVFLPPVVAAFYSPALGEVVFGGSENIAKWFLDNVLALGGINEYLRSQYDLTGIAYVLMWLAISVPLGWFVGGLVALANTARPD